MRKRQHLLAVLTAELTQHDHQQDSLATAIVEGLHRQLSGLAAASFRHHGRGVLLVDARRIHHGMLKIQYVSGARFARLPSAHQPLVAAMAHYAPQREFLVVLQLVNSHWLYHLRTCYNTSQDGTG
jgi:hypothetical protein